MSSRRRVFLPKQMKQQQDQLRRERGAVSDRAEAFLFAIDRGPLTPEETKTFREMVAQLDDLAVRIELVKFLHIQKLIDRGSYVRPCSKDARDNPLELANNYVRGFPSRYTRVIQKLASEVGLI